MATAPRRDCLLALGLTTAALAVASSRRAPPSAARLGGLVAPAVAALVLVRGVLRVLRRGSPTHDPSRPRVCLVPPPDPEKPVRVVVHPCEVTPPTDHVSPMLSSHHPSDMHLRKVSFNPRVFCTYVRDLTDLPDARKSIIWWQQEDFDEFLKVRVEIGKAYRAAAKLLGLDVMQVSSIGSHGDEGYRAMIQIMPELAHESRRGLGLGRKRQRAKNRDCYIASVINEQQRQRDTFIIQHGEGVPFELDDDMLGRIARAVSKRDLDYAVKLAHLYYEQDRAAEFGAAETAPAAPPALVSAPSSRWQPSDLPMQLPSPGLRRTESSSSLSCADPSSPIRTQGSFSLNDEEDPEVLRNTSRRKLGEQRAYSKGFGLSREKLAGYGLSATGHSLSRLAGGRRAADEDTDGAETGGETEDEDDDAREQADIIAQYRNWRAGGPGKSAPPPKQSEAHEEYGSRETYRHWRAWAAASAAAGAKSRSPSGGRTDDDAASPRAGGVSVAEARGWSSEGSRRGSAQGAGLRGGEEAAAAADAEGASAATSPGRQRLGSSYYAEQQRRA